MTNKDEIHKTEELKLIIKNDRSVESPLNTQMVSNNNNMDKNETELFSVCIVSKNDDQQNRSSSSVSLSSITEDKALDTCSICFEVINVQNTADTNPANIQTVSNSTPVLPANNSMLTFSLLSLDTEEIDDSDSNNSNDNAPVMSEMDSQSLQLPVRSLQCGHHFHTQCIDEWSSTKLNADQLPDCPLCKKPLIESEIPNEIIEQYLYNAFNANSNADDMQLNFNNILELRRRRRQILFLNPNIPQTCITKLVSRPFITFLLRMIRHTWLILYFLIILSIDFHGNILLTLLFFLALIIHPLQSQLIFFYFQECLIRRIPIPLLNGNQSQIKIGKKTAFTIWLSVAIFFILIAVLCRLAQRDFTNVATPVAVYMCFTLIIIACLHSVLFFIDVMLRYPCLVVFKVMFCGRSVDLNAEW